MIVNGAIRTAALRFVESARFNFRCSKIYSEGKIVKVHGRGQRMPLILLGRARLKSLSLHHLLCLSGMCWFGFRFCHVLNMVL